MAGREAVLDLRGMGGFIPYSAVEELVRKTGKVVVRADEEVARLLRLWAERRGYLVEISVDRVTIRRPVTGEERREAPEAAAGARLLLDVDESRWSEELSQRLSEAKFIINVVLTAPIVYRGPAETPEFSSAISSTAPLLLRVQLGGADYFLLVREGKVVAGAQLGSALTREQARSIVKTVLEDSSVHVTIYDVSSLSGLS